jgi:hypothetical protein
MAKLGSFLRRLFTTNSSGDHRPSSPSRLSEPHKGILIMPPLSSSKLSPSKLTTITTRSCTVSPQPLPHTVIKQTTVHVDNMNVTSNSNFLSSDINKINNRRLSAPHIVHTSTHYQSQYPSTIVNEDTEDALLSSLHRASFSSSPATTMHPYSSIHSLGSNVGAPTIPLSRPEVRSASFNLTSSPSSLSNNLINNISPASGR